VVLGRPSCADVQAGTARHCGLVKEARRAGMTEAMAKTATWFRAATVNELQYDGDLLNGTPSKSSVVYLLPEDPNAHEGVSVFLFFGWYSFSLLEYYHNIQHGSIGAVASNNIQLDSMVQQHPTISNMVPWCSNIYILI